MTIIEIILLYLQTGTTARFDFEGNLVTSDEGIDVKLGLHHHGNEPEVRHHRCFLHTSLLTIKKTFTVILFDYVTSFYCHQSWHNLKVELFCA